MGRFGHLATIAGYTAGAAALSAAGVVFAGMTLGVAILAGLVLLLGAALLHEVAARQQADRQAMRRLLLLKRAFDRSGQEIAITRDEIRRLFETVEGDGGEALIQAIEAASAERARTLAEETERTGPGATDAPPRADRTATDDPETQAELRVLHQLVEQLYADDELGPKRDASGAPISAPKPPRAVRREPPLGRDRRPPELRVVADDGPNGLNEARVIEIVREGLREDRVDLHLQPIVSLPQRKTRFYECFSRIRGADGTVVTPDQYIEPARRGGLLTAVDNMLLFRCVQLVRKAHRAESKASFFCALSAHTLSDRAFFRDFIAFMENHRELTGSLVLEMTQADFDHEREALAADLGRLGAMGFRLALSHVRDLDLDLDALATLNVQFVKIDAGLVLETLAAEGETAMRLRELKQRLDRREIDLIVDGIETERMLVELLEFSIDFGQGYLFGEPKPAAAAAGDGNARDARPG